MKANRKFMDEDAVSPVIGVILMVAITVILAAVIAAFVFGMGSSLKRQYVVSATATQVDANTVEITFSGGTDADYVYYLNASIGGKYFAAGDSVTGSDVEQNTFGGTGDTHINVGKTVSITEATPTYITTARDHLVLTAQFADGTRQIILDTYV